MNTDLVATTNQFAAKHFLEHVADDGALGVPEHEARSHQFVDGEQIELLAQHAVIATLGFLEPIQVGFQIVL